jgi:exopolysaccharide biosynthesis polyprenyl glycosylphosphotransferase
MKTAVKRNVGFVFLRLVSDLILIPGVIIVAYSLKFKLGWLFQNLLSLEAGRIYDHAQVEPYLQVMGVFIMVWIVAFYFSGLYKSEAGISPQIDIFIKSVKGVSIATLQVMAVSFVYKSFPGSRYVLAYSWGVGIVAVTFSRIMILSFETWLYKKGVGSFNTLVIGGGAVGQDIAEKMVLFPTLRLKYIGFLDDGPPEKVHYHLRRSFKLLGTIQEYKEVCEANDVRVLFLTRRDVPQRFILKLIAYCEESNIQLKILSDMIFLTPLTVSEVFDGMPVLSTGQRMNSGGAFAKRSFDLITSILGLLLLFPLFFMIACLIKLISPEGPVFFRQDRVTLDGRTFKMIKFRSMVPNAEKDTGPVMVCETEETRYIPAIGKLMRHWSLDELPQLINVLKGDMSIVGPRPERPHFVKEFSRSIPYFNFRHRVRGGITGWAQVNGRSVLTRRPEHKIKYDIYYIKNWSFILDIKILFKTVFVVFTREEVY